MSSTMPSRAATIILSAAIATFALATSVAAYEPINEITAAMSEITDRKSFDGPSGTPDSSPNDPWNDSAPGNPRGDDSSHPIPEQHPDNTPDSDAAHPDGGNTNEGSSHRDCAHYDKQHDNGHGGHTCADPKPRHHH